MRNLMRTVVLGTCVSDTDYRTVPGVDYFGTFAGAD